MSRDYQGDCDSTAANTQQPAKGYDVWTGDTTTTFVPNSISSYGYITPITLQQAIDTYKREFGKNWMYYFKATVKVTL